MRRLTTGVDAAGRSCLVEEVDLPLEPAGVDGILSALVTSTAAALPPRPAGRATTNDLGVGPGQVGWFVVEYEPNLQFPMHNTDTVDFDILLEGSLVLGLDDGDHPLEPGDVLIVNGVDHSWRAGPQGCRLSVLSIGTPPPG